MKSKIFLSIFLFAVTLISYSQRVYVANHFNNGTFKRHYSYSIETGYVDGQLHQFIAGDKTDWMSNSRVVAAHKITGSTINPEKVRSLGATSPDYILLTDIAIQQGNDYRYGAGTGIYFPTGPTGMGYPFFGLYDKKTMDLISLVYYNLSYPADVIAKHAAGVRIKYSEREDAYYISGIMVDRPFIDLNFNDIQGRSKGFIMKVFAGSLTAQVLVLNPDVMQPGIPEICSVNDMEINSDQTGIYFTGVNTESTFNGLIQPMVGQIDMNLNLLWCKTYEITEERYSGIDVEFGQNQESLFVLMNSGTYPFAIMELDIRGVIVQHPVIYNLSIADQEFARGHIMHYTESNGLIVTGNSYIQNGHSFYQDLFKYDIPSAANLQGGNLSFDVYTRQLVPLGSQINTTSWWAPENSVYVNSSLALIGIYNNNNASFGFSYIYVPGYDTECLLPGEVQIHEYVIAHNEDMTGYLTSCSNVQIPYFEPLPNYQQLPQDCPPAGKSSLIESNDNNNDNIRFAGMDNNGINLIVNSEQSSDYRITVYDVTGRAVHTESIKVNGEKIVYLKFNTSNQLYMINIQNGLKSETIKVSGVK